MKSNTYIRMYRYLSWFLIVVIIIGLAKIRPSYLEAARRLEDSYGLYRGIYIFGTFLIGILLKQDRLLIGYFKGFRISWIELIIPLAILIYLLFPWWISVDFTGIGLWHTITQEGTFRSILGVSGGAILVQAITQNDDMWLKESLEEKQRKRQ